MGLLMLILFAWALYQPLLSGDLGWHIRTGDYVLTHHEVPRVHFLCWTGPWFPWISHEWLSGVIFAWVDQLLGLPGLLWMRALLFTITLVLMYRLGRKLEAEPLTLALLTFLFAIGLALHVSLRPWLFSNLLLALSLHLSHRARVSSHPGSAYLQMIGLLGIWINLHGSFVVGVGLLSLLLFDHWRGRTLITASLVKRSSSGKGAAPSLLSHLLARLRARVRTSFEVLFYLVLLGLALLVNPHGLEALALPFRYLLGDDGTGLAMTSEIKEWAPLDLSSFFGRVYLIWLALGLTSMLASRFARRRPEALLALLFSLLTLGAQRHLPIMTLFWFPVVAEGLLFPLSIRLDRSSRPLLRFVRGISHQEEADRSKFLMLTIMLLTMLYASGARSEDFELSKAKAKGFPVVAVQHLRERPPARLFNHYDWGGYIVWRAPEWRLFISPVNDAYPRTRFEDWRRIANMQPGWQDTLSRYGVDTVLMPSTSTLAQTLSASTDWKVVYQDDTATLLEKTPLSTTGVTEPHVNPSGTRRPLPTPNSTSPTPTPRIPASR